MTTTTIMASRRCDDDDCQLEIDNNDNDDDDYADGFDWCQTTRKLTTKQNKKQPKTQLCSEPTLTDISSYLVDSYLQFLRGDTTQLLRILYNKIRKKRVSLSRSRGFQSRPGQHSGPQSNKICPGMPSIDQFRYFQIQLLTIQFSTRLGGINHTKNVFYSPEARAEVYYLQLNFKISKIAYHIHGYINMRHTMFPDPFR